MKMIKLATADFETTTDENDCRVWAWGICDIENINNFIYGNTIESFFNYLEESNNQTLYFHNAKFDCEFIISYLLNNGFIHTDRKNEKTKTFTTLISDKGQFFSMKIIFQKKNKQTKYVQIYDSLKIIPFAVDVVAKSFNLPISKLKIDYKKYRPYGHKLTQDEIDYLRGDVTIMAMALSTLFKQNLDKMTQASNALHDYKNIVSEKSFDMWFPTPDYDIDQDIRQSYKGGFTYLNPLYKGINIESGIVLDVNSLYPYVMHNRPLPYGQPIFFKGKYEPVAFLWIKEERYTNAEIDGLPIKRFSPITIVIRL